MKFTAEDLEPLWQRAYANYFGRPPYEVVVAAVRFAGDRALAVHAEAAIGDSDTTWRLIWLTSAHLGIVDARGDITDWSAQHSRLPGDVQVSTTIRPLADCRRVTYEQAAVHAERFGSTEFDARGVLCLHFDDGRVRFDRSAWTYGNSDTQDALEVAIVDRWTALGGV